LLIDCVYDQLLTIEVKDAEQAQQFIIDEEITIPRNTDCPAFQGETSTCHVGHGFEQHRVTKLEDVHFEGNSCNNFLYFEKDKNSDRSVQL
jgi:hypothetical protein